MEEAMSHTALSPGTDEKVKLPNLTEEEVDWRGLEDLYSVNKSLYQGRTDDTPSPEDWANFQKDVDNMFALRHVLDKLNHTHELDKPSLAEGASGAGAGALDEGSGEWGPRVVIWPGLVTTNQATVGPHITPAPSTTPAPPAPSPTPERELESVNDLPQRPMDRPIQSVMSPATSSVSLPPGQWRLGAVSRGDGWARQLEELDGEGEGLTFSGNGLTELETRHNVVLRTHNSLQAPLQSQLGREGPGLGLELEDEEDIFHAQGYLPLSLQTMRPTAQAGSTTGNPPPRQTSAPQGAGEVTQPHQTSQALDYEGSGSPPEPSHPTQ